MSIDNLVLVVGDATAVSGTYLLRIEVAEEMAVRFGRFNEGEPISIPAGAYLYVGSAMRGLGSRLLRHASRSNPQSPHHIRPTLAEELRIANIKGRIPRQKRCHWHVDYLLERPQAALTQVIIIRSQERLEAEVADWLMSVADTAVLAAGLGASDHQGKTHLLRIPDSTSWWMNLPHSFIIHHSQFLLNADPSPPLTSDLPPEPLPGPPG